MTSSDLPVPSETPGRPDMVTILVRYDNAEPMEILSARPVDWRSDIAADGHRFVAELLLRSAMEVEQWRS